MRHIVLLAMILTSNFALAIAVDGPTVESAAASSKTKTSKASDKAGKKEIEQLYQRGTEALDAQRWAGAVEAFERVSDRGGARADGALYWTAYAQHKLGRGGVALTKLQELRERFPSSRWNNEAKALELEIRQSSGQQVAPERVADDELKLIAITGLLSADQDRAVTLLEKMLTANNSPEVKERALFVLSQSKSPRAQQLIEGMARGNSGSELQQKALQLLGVTGGERRRGLLAEIYRGSTDPEVKGAVLQGLLISGDRARLLQVASGDKDPQFRSEAARLLGAMGANAELAQLYESESSSTVKEDIIQGMFIGGHAGKLGELARTERDPELRAAAIRGLGLLGKGKAGEILVQIYASDTSQSSRLAVIEALFIQGNAKTLVDLARKEKDRELKHEIVEKLSLLQSKEATDYMLEVLQE